MAGVLAVFLRLSELCAWSRTDHAMALCDGWEDQR